MIRLFFISVMMASVTTTASATPTAVTSSRPEVSCQVSTHSYLNSSSADDADFVPTVLTKLKAAGCKAGDIIWFNGVTVMGAAASRFCDFSQTIYADGGSLACRWIGRVRDNVDTSK